MLLGGTPSPQPPTKPLSPPRGATLPPQIWGPAPCSHTQHPQEGKQTGEGSTRNPTAPTGEAERPLPRDVSGLQGLVPAVGLTPQPHSAGSHFASPPSPPAAHTPCTHTHTPQAEPPHRPCCRAAPLTGHAVGLCARRPHPRPPGRPRRRLLRSVHRCRCRPLRAPPAGRHGPSLRAAMATAADGRAPRLMASRGRGEGGGRGCGRKGGDGTQRGFNVRKGLGMLTGSLVGIFLHSNKGVGGKSCPFSSAVPRPQAPRPAFP